MESLIGVGAFALFAMLWLAFGVALVVSQGSIDTTWQWITGLPWFGQVVVWILFLPIVAGIWIWEAGWPLAVRVAVVLALAGVNLSPFFPRGVFGRG